MRGMSMGMGMTLALLASTSVAAIDAPFVSVNGTGAYDGGFVEYAATPTITEDVPFTVVRQGFDATGAAHTYMDTLYVPKTTSLGGAVRQPYPNHALQMPTKAALSDYIYSTDTPSGSVTNNSTLTSPKPVAGWERGARRLIGNTVGGDVFPIEISAFHRNARLGREVACVIVRFSDGVNPDVTGTISATEVSTFAGDKKALTVFKLGEVDLSSLDDGMITMNAKVYPWIGDASSVLDSADQTAQREFSPRYFHKNPTKFATPDVMYVNSTTGNDTTAAVNNGALPAATIMGAINRMRVTGYSTATTQIVIKNDATHPFTGSASGASTGYAAGLLVTRDPATTTLAGCIVQFGTNAIPNLEASLPSPITEASIVFKDVSLARTSTLYFVRGSTLHIECQIELCPVDNNNSGTTWVNVSDYCLYGVEISNPGGGGFNQNTTGQHRIWRGVSMTPNGGTIEVYHHTACDIVVGTALTTTGYGTTQDGLIMYCNAYRKINHTTGWFTISTEITKGFSYSQNLIEYIKGGTVIHSLGISHDGATNNTTHAILHNNTVVGAYEAGRWNVFYDEGATARTNKLQSVIGNIIVAFYIKGDVFVTNGARLGNVGPTYGVGMRNNFTMYQSNSALGGIQAPAFEGIGSIWGTSTSVRNDPLFTSYAGTTGTTGAYVAGLGDGDYTLDDLSPCKGLVTDAVLSHDLLGNARSVTGDTAGAYA